MFQHNIFTSRNFSGDIRVERLGEELSSDSSVWLSYVATAAASDAEMIDNWNKGLDVLLIFVRPPVGSWVSQLLIFITYTGRPVCSQLL